MSFFVKQRRYEGKTLYIICLFCLFFVCFEPQKGTTLAKKGTGGYFLKINILPNVLEKGTGENYFFLERHTCCLNKICWSKMSSMGLNELFSIICTSSRTTHGK